MEENANAEARARGASKPLPKTLGDLLEEFCREHGDRNLQTRTVERYRDLVRYLSAELLAMPIAEVSPLHLTREWNRLRVAGGHDPERIKRGLPPKPLAATSVRSIAGFVATAYAHAIGWGLVTMNPVTNSTKPSGSAKRKTALSPRQQRLLLDSSNNPLLTITLEVCAGLGARRGEVLALRWSDITADGQVQIGRSLTQTKRTLKFKEPKTPAGFRTVTIPASVLKKLEKHKEQQATLRAQFGPDYREQGLVICNPDGSPVKPGIISGLAHHLCRKLKF